MIRFFRKIRQNLLFEDKLGKYLLYAVGEVLLVVIGILIALQINDQNDLRKERIKELHYLENIKTDLNINLFEMDRYLDVRTEYIEGAKRYIEHFEGKPITDYSAFNADGVKIYSWQKFYQNNNTFQELVNSGNLALISNESIKNRKLKNGFVLAVLQFTVMNGQMREIKQMTEELILSIDQEIQKG